MNKTRIIKQLTPKRLHSKIDVLAERVHSRLKLYNRTERQLANRFEGLKRTAAIMDELGVKWHVSGGTALGAARNGDFIPWDWDVGIGVKIEEVFHRRDEIVTRFVHEGFKLKFVNDRPLKETISFGYKGENYEILCWTRDGNNRKRATQIRPDKYFENLEMRNFKGISLPFPCPLEDYLEFLYGDWKTPKKTANKTTYRHSGTWINSP